MRRGVCLILLVGFLWERLALPVYGATICLEEKEVAEVLEALEKAENQIQSLTDRLNSITELHQQLRNTYEEQRQRADQLWKLSIELKTSLEEQQKEARLWKGATLILGGILMGILILGVLHE